MGYVSSKEVADLYGKGTVRALRELADQGSVKAFDPKTLRELRVVGPRRPVLFLEDEALGSRGYLETKARLNGLISVKEYAQRNHLVVRNVYQTIRAGGLLAFDADGNPVDYLNRDARRVFLVDYTIGSSTKWFVRNVSKLRALFT